MVVKSKVFIKCNAKEFDSWDFCKNWISNSNLNWIFLVGDYHIWSFTDVESKSVDLEPVINAYQLPIHSGMDIVNVTVGCKNCCIISKINKAHLIWGSIHVIDIQKKEYWAQHRALWNTQCNVWHRGIAVSDWDLLFLVTQIRRKPVLHNTPNAIMQELTHYSFFRIASYITLNNIQLDLNCFSDTQFCIIYWVKMK